MIYGRDEAIRFGEPVNDSTIWAFDPARSQD